MAILAQLSLAEEFIRTILPGDMNYRLFNSEADQMIKIWEGFGKALKKNKPLKYNPSLSPEAKKYLKRYSKFVALNLVELRNKAQTNTIVPVKTEFEKMELERYKLRTEGFILNFEHTEDNSTKAFVKLVEDTKNMILGEKENS
nr:hypothetical protein [uncultured Treponema sp.]